MIPQLGQWCREMQALAQNGLAYSKDPYDIERFHRLQGIVAEMLSAVSDDSLESTSQLIGLEEGYLTPKVDVRAGVFRDDRLLMIREASDGLWSLPGGWADINDPPSDAVVREVLEETGFTVSCQKLVALFDRDRQGHPPMHYHVYKLYFLCQIESGTATTSSESTAVDFFALDALPSLSTARVTEKQLRMLARHQADVDLPTEFD